VLEQVEKDVRLRARWLGEMKCEDLHANRPMSVADSIALATSSSPLWTGSAKVTLGDGIRTMVSGGRVFDASATCVCAVQPGLGPKTNALCSDIGIRITIERSVASIDPTCGSDS
jgi:hypothetical protein